MMCQLIKYTYNKIRAKNGYVNMQKRVSTEIKKDVAREGKNMFRYVFFLFFEILTIEMTIDHVYMSFF